MQSFSLPPAQVVEQGIVMLGLGEEVNGLPLDKQAEACLEARLDRHFKISGRV